jgi:hypothetical protein
MPSTETNVELIQRRVSESTTQQILDALDEIQLIVYSQDCFQTQKIDSTGMPPFLETVEDVYEYDCPSDCRKTAAIFTEEPARGYSRISRNECEYSFNGKRYIMAQWEGRDATIETVSKVYFKQDPGTTDSIYYHLYYMKPARITNIEIQLVIPEEYHYLLRKAVISMLTTESYGDSAYDINAIENISKTIRAKLNSGYGSVLGQAIIQPEHLDYPGIR